MILMMNSNHPGPINIGNPVEFTIRQLAEIVVDRINPGLELLICLYPQDDPLRCPDISSYVDFGLDAFSVSRRRSLSYHRVLPKIFH